ncbi:hypothetical protein BDY19DRAFT_289343 [Irpex rosettiformis]|uniref:Uncharacterized protein n=1 Tax=Irpex rosettiformis TaxID=378272 RepID=A0ACB8UIN7_9APHY|nr:hypothetical protein BDY19DRAFT_289343 [Irpex rosettiformis]
MAAAEYQLGITPVKVDALPAEGVLINQGRALIDVSSNWQKNKTFHKVVQTYLRPKIKGEPANWWCRVSEHGQDEATFDEFWDKLGKNKGENEVNYVKVVKKATLIKQISPTQAIWSMYYKFPPPVSPRVFTVLQTIQYKETSPRTGLIVSIPVDLSPDPELAKKEEKGVKARYASVELLTELENAKIEWKMATTSRAEGLIPQFLTEASMPSNISHDVPGFLNWIKTLRKPEGGSVPVKDQTAVPPSETAPLFEEPSDTDTNVPLDANAVAAAPITNAPPVA